MRPASAPIGVVEDARGIVLSLPHQFWLVVGLRRTFPRVQAAEAPWSYRVPAARGVAAKIEAWIAEVEVQARAESRRRAWTATDAEWEGAGAPEPPRPVSAEPAIVVLPKRRTARAVLALLADLAAGAVMVTTVSSDGVRGYRLAPAGRPVRTAVADRAIRDRLIAPGNDGLFGPEWSQTWRAPTAEEIARAAPRPRKTKAAAKPKPASARRARPAPSGGVTRRTAPVTRRSSSVAPEEVHACQPHP